MNHIDLFSGIGGFALAARANGIRTDAFFEIDPFCSRLLASRFPKVPNFGDVRNADASRVRFPFLLTGGFPCQPFSCAGQRRGKADDRYLWPAMRDAIALFRPTWVLAENVPGIIYMELDAVLLDMADLGYSAQPITIPACAIGAPHIRKRTWILAHAESSREGSKKYLRQFDASVSSGKDVADAHGTWKPQQEGLQPQQPNGIVDGRQNLAYPAGERLQVPPRSHEGSQFHGWGSIGCRGWWESEPDVGRMAHGVPSRVDRLRGLGNSIVPEIAFELIRLMILATAPTSGATASFSDTLTACPAVNL